MAATPVGGLLDIPDVDNRSCQLLGPTALIVQALMGVLVILSLVYKRHRESPKRPWRIWLFDVSKQVVGQLFVHAVNLFVSDLGSDHTESNACVFYFLNILIDTTLGVALIYLILHFFTHIFSQRFGLQGFESGIYGTPPSVNYWARQAAIYVLSLTTMKLMVVALLALFPGIFKIGEWILSWTWTEDGDTVQVIFTMGIFPIIMNIVQFWLIDSIVKASAAVSLDADSPDIDDSEHREPLFNAPSDDEDEDDRKPGDVENQRLDRGSHGSTDSYRMSRDKSFSDASDDIKSRTASSSSGPRDQHSYPPSLSSSLSSSGSDPSKAAKAAKSAANLLKKKRRGPPAPLHIERISQPVINSPQVSAPPAATSMSKTPMVEMKPPAITRQQSTTPKVAEWTDSWEDDEDEWAKGNNTESQKPTIDGVWEDH
ncbi:hypothetical protein AGABI1DRAFT_72625 [Agaricus bisporus var. burnettii JB137-S8]|uniref:Vacuolar membrane protein n=1 Tax=Agaricus bisporus var. burnettii (strain JB137-S8 / ATCC MYA-4627 / FGSC 10392) TaxID=597362 RepID=K5VZG9_AGABU|nr:uncharacterized protein AGABI1DRAFT_72625 [Agaricus bisporus var. burnettii JB137-S8]EKM79919.1 hypothetical protein AGABI1DRAFT_72625 [Agaricus bisporus var. burnettii JB137-S8]